MLYEKMLVMPFTMRGQRFRVFKINSSAIVHVSKIIAFFLLDVEFFAYCDIQGRQSILDRQCQTGEEFQGRPSRKTWTHDNNPNVKNF